MRSITAAAQTKLDALTGTRIVRVLQIDFGGATGTKYYSDVSLVSPVTAEKRILSWGGSTIEAQPGRAGGHGTRTLELSDTDHTLQALFDTSPGIQSKHCIVWMYLEGTTWATDRIKEFQGTVVHPTKKDHRGVYSVHLRGLESTLSQRSIGAAYSRTVFPEVICSQCEGKIIPIVFGDPVYRVPACPIDRPGSAFLNASLNIHDNTLTINQTASDAGFTTGSQITIYVGSGENQEAITGQFNSGSDTVFNITSRGAILAEGNSPGVFAEGGVQTFLINKYDVPNYGQPRTGYPIWIYDPSEGWVMFTITSWRFEGGYIGVVREPSNMNFLTGQDWKIGATPGYIPVFGTGTPVNEDGSTTYVANFLPSEYVTAVEARGVSSASGPGGDQSPVYHKYNGSYYSVDLNNQSYNTDLGRGGSDPGITTITVNKPPSFYGFENDILYCTIGGVTDTGIPSGNALEDPADIILELLQNEFLGNIDSSYIDTAAFTAARGSLSFAFALTEEMDLNKLCGDLAYQMGALYFWDQGAATISPVDATLSGSKTSIGMSDLIDPFTEGGEFSYESMDQEQQITRITGKFRESYIGPQSVFQARANTPGDSWGDKSKEIDFWAFQDRDHVETQVAFWLLYYVQMNRTVRIKTRLTGLKFQPGDLVAITYQDGGGNNILNAVAGRVLKVTHETGSITSSIDMVTLECAVNLWTFSLTTVAAATKDCNTTIEAPALFDPDSAFVPPDNADPDSFESGNVVITSDALPGGSHISSGNLLSGGNIPSGGPQYPPSGVVSGYGSGGSDPLSPCVEDYFTGGFEGQNLTARGWTKSGSANVTLNNQSQAVANNSSRYVRTGFADAQLSGSVIINEAGKSAYVYFRFVDANNWLRLEIVESGTINLQKFVAGVLTTVATASVTVGVGNVIPFDITFCKQSVTVASPGSLSGTIADHESETGFGLGANGKTFWNSISECPVACSSSSDSSSSGDSSSSSDSSSGGSSDSSSSSSSSGSTVYDLTLRDVLTDLDSRPGPFSPGAISPGTSIAGVDYTASTDIQFEIHNNGPGPITVTISETGAYFLGTNSNGPVEIPAGNFETVIWPGNNTSGPETSIIEVSDGVYTVFWNIYGEGL